MTQSDANALKIYLTRSTNKVDNFKFNFDIKESRINGDRLIFDYDLYINYEQKDIPWLWDYFHCKSNHIIESACEFIGIDFGKVKGALNDTYLGVKKIERYGGYIPKWFEDKAHELFKANTVKSIETYFYCGNQKRILKLYLRYYGSDTYIDDGIVSNITIDCIGIALDGVLINITNEEILELITGYIIEMDYIKQGLDGAIWDEINEYMKLGDCDIWTHTYVNMGTINDIPIDSYDYVGQSTFSNKMCDFINGEF
jgi:hypothetical protein